jgi:hypothetical protein
MGDDSGADRFFPDIGVDEAGDSSRVEFLNQPFFKAPNRQHCVEQFDLQFLAEVQWIPPWSAGIPPALKIF